MAVGKIYFAEVDPGDSFDPNVHNVEDQLVYKLQITQSEGSFAIASVEIANPGQGLLNPARKKRIFISYDDGGVATLLFSGRITGYPSDLAREVINVDYVAQGETWRDDQNTFMQGLKVSPYYNELFIAEDRRDDPSEILAARSSVINWDRKTNAISLSDIIQGAVTIDLADSIPFDNIQVEIGDPPSKKVRAASECQWEQFGVGEVNCGEQIRLGFPNTKVAQEEVSSLTPQAFEDGWRGVTVPDGYRVKESKLIPVANDFGLAQADLRSDTITVNASDFPTGTGDTVGTRPVSVPRVWYTADLLLSAVYQQKRRESFFQDLEVDLQEFSLKAEQDDEVSVRFQDPTADAQGTVLDAKLPSFFVDKATSKLSTIGEDAISHSLLRGRARLCKANRVINTRFDAKLDDVIDVDCDSSIRIQDSRIPGGSIRGKVTKYVFLWDGDSGQQIAQINIESVIGNGTDSTELGTLDQVEIGTEIYDNEFGAATMTSAIWYDLNTVPVLDQPIDVEQMESDTEYLIDGVVVSGDGESQADDFLAENITAPENGTGRPDTALENNPTGIDIDLKSMNPQSEITLEIDLQTSIFTLPKQVDMEA